jgi:peptidoglycan-N-acetylglucosamine deacetylase
VAELALDRSCVNPEEGDMSDKSYLRVPDGKRMACCFCFDFDALSLWQGLFRWNTANPLSRGEFGARVAIPRILNLLDKYNIKATFFVPAHTAMVFPDSVKEIHSRGHEIAAHSMYHAPFEVGLEMSGVEPASPERQRGYIEQQLEILTNTVGDRPNGFRSPIGDWAGDHVPKALIEFGFTYDSSLQGHDFLPYRLRLGDEYGADEPFEVKFGEPSSLLEIPLHWDVNDFAQFEFLGYYLNAPANPWFSPSPFNTAANVKANFTGSFDACYEHIPGGIWNTILHPQACGRDMKIDWLESVIQHTYDKSDVWYATMSEVVAAWDDGHAAGTRDGALAGTAS